MEQRKTKDQKEQTKKLVILPSNVRFLRLSAILTLSAKKFAI